MQQEQRLLHVDCMTRALYDVQVDATALGAHHAGYVAIDGHKLGIVRTRHQAHRHRKERKVEPHVVLQAKLWANARLSWSTGTFARSGRREDGEQG